MENMEGDDEVIVVVIGDEDDGENEENRAVSADNTVSVKVEALDEEMGVEEMLETVERHGEVVDVDLRQIIKSEPVQYIEGEEVEFIDDTFWDVDVDEPVDDSQAESLEGEAVHLIPRKRGKKSKDSKEVFRHSMLKPHERKSFVKQLKKERPELKKNEKLLINTLADFMRNIKQPELPSNYCYVNDQAEMQCSKCTHVTKTLAAAGRHYQEMHGERYLICFACGVDFRSKTNLYKHEKRCAAADAVVVLKARALYVGRKARSRPFIPHYDEPYKKKSYYKRGDLRCDMCPARFSSKVALQAHLYLHNGLRPFRCPECPAAYTSPTALSRHMAKHTSIEYICDHCKRSFKVKSALVVHMNTHKPEKRFGCELCPKRYAQKSALVLHVNRVHHRLPPPCACKICPKRFPRMSLLKSHMLKEHGMSILTRKMFLRYLPTMPDEEVVEQAKLVFKEESEPYESGSEIMPDDNSIIMEESAMQYQNSEADDDSEYIGIENEDIEPTTEEPEYKIEISQLPMKVNGDLNVHNFNGLSLEQAELLKLLADAQQNVDNVKLFSVRNGKMVQVALTSEEHEIAHE